MGWGGPTGVALLVAPGRPSVGILAAALLGGRVAVEGIYMVIRLLQVLPWSLWPFHLVVTFPIHEVYAFDRKNVHQSAFFEELLIQNSGGLLAAGYPLAVSLKMVSKLLTPAPLPFWGSAGALYLVTQFSFQLGGEHHGIALMYVLVPMPCMFFGGGSTQFLISRDGGGWIDAAKFLTGASAVGSIAIPMILRHANLIETGAMVIELTSFFIFVCTVLCFHRASLDDEW
ncbi:hypothetical protein Cgig2_003518 [Carnegiea gigantea]|uniref:Uncharacterized protein n=1 Tax=Carnegiea gigantea TaxID=171969 RepID=A0A9Q1JRZ1_9CARY|nr:hypothetical protein Cgig2_003518 [Carnegiea gigantea]